MIRLVLDTNVLVSGLLKPSGAEGRIIDRVVAGVATVCVSDRVTSLLREIKRVSVHTAPPVRLSVSRDEADNRFLECAQAAAARFIVTGNRRHFPARWVNTEIVSARELTRLLAVS